MQTSDSSTTRVVIYVYEGMTLLDAVGPYEIVRQLSNTSIKFVAKKRGEITADSGVAHLNSKHSIDEIKSADILIIPGSTIAFVREMKDKKVLQWIKDIDKKTQKTVTVCTGSLILAATGSLKNHKATSHWQPLPLLSKFEAIPTRERIVESGKYITAAGVSAGIDMAIYLANQLRGEIEAKAAQLAIEYDPKPMFNSGNYNTATEEILELATKNLTKDAKNNLSLWDILKNFKLLKSLKVTKDHL
ncbi:MAG: DJ-1/PfpI family protein [Flavicella sp.]